MKTMKTIVCGSLRELDKKYDRYILRDPDDQFLLRFKENCGKLLSWEEEENGYYKIMQLYAQALLDLTFYEESKLVESEFLASDSLEKLHSIIDCLTSIEDLCKEYTESPATLLGLEIEECLLWRRGALLYMYCAIVEEKKERLASEKEHFLKCLYDGIKYLEQMLNIRKPLMVPRAKVESNEDDTYFLLSEGIYSDTTILALMYAGEMCYWYIIHKNDTINFDLNAAYLGRKFLEKYIKACEGPLKGKGWNCVKARELLVHM